MTGPEGFWLERQFDEAWATARQEMPPEFHLNEVRRQDREYVAIAWHRGDDILVRGKTPGQAVSLLVAECRSRSRSDHL